MVMCSSRSIDDIGRIQMIDSIMDTYFKEHKVGILVRGDEGYVENRIARISQNYHYQVRIYFAHYRLLSIPARYKRNKYIIDNERPDILVAFVDKNTKLSNYTISYAERRGIKVFKYYI